jgi:predicted type IV restriction endonuclease
MEKRKYTVTQIAAMCGMTRDGIHKALRRGKFPHAKKVKQLDGQYMYEIPRHDVREYLLFEHDISLAEKEVE